MLGLIKKDLLLMKTNAKSLLVIFIIYLLMAINGNFDIVVMLPLFIMVLLISTFGYDEYNNWDAYVNALPVGRKNIILSKYLTSAILLVCSSIISCIIAYVLTFFYEKSDISHSLSYIGGCLCGMLITISLMYPLIFKYGSQKGRIAGFVLIAGSGFVLGLLSKIKAFSTVVNSLETYFLIAFIVLTILMLIGSYIISVKIYSKREF